MKKNLDMTEGKPISLLWAFTFPTLMGNLLNQVYSITDSIVVGRYLGQTALAAVGSTMPVILLLAALMIGINVGVGIIISRYFGQKNEELMRRAFVNSLYLGLFLSAGMMVMGLTFSGTILRWMGTPEGPLQEATAYLEISFITMICPLMYYLFSSAFRGLGDSQTALYCLIVSVLSNIGLDVLFVAVFRWGVAGSAWATALAQALSAVVAAVLLFRKYPMMRMRRQDLRLHGKLLRQITVLAIPIAVQSAFNNLGNLVAQSAVNLFGEATMAAYTAASRIGTLALMPVETIGSSLSVYASQNHGAGKPQRIRQGVRASLQLSLVVSTVLGVFLLLCGRQMAGLFLAEPSAEILTVVQRFLLITAVPGILAGVMQVYQQVLRGVDRANQALMGGVMQLITKIAVVAVGAWGMRNLDVVWLGWPASFVAGTVIPCAHAHGDDGRFGVVVGHLGGGGQQLQHIGTALWHHGQLGQVGPRLLHGHHPGDQLGLGRGLMEVVAGAHDLDPGGVRVLNQRG